MRGWTDEGREAVRRGHNLGVAVELWAPAGKVADLPIVEGEVNWSLTTSDGVRGGRLSLPGYEWFEIAEPGQSTWVNVTVTLEKQTFNLGQFPILRCTVTRPGGLVQLDLGDWAYRRHIPQAVGAATIGSTGEAIATTVATYMSHVLPPVSVMRDDSGGAGAITPLQIKLGDSVWSALFDLCEQRGCVPVMTSRQTVEIRNFNAQGEVYDDDLTGTVIRESIGILADEAVNHVIAVVESSDFKDGNPLPNMRQEKKLEIGPYRWNAQGFGVNTIVVNERTPVATQAQADSLCYRTYERRAGIVRTQSVDIIPTPWLEVGDTVSWQPSFLDYPLFGRIETISFPLTADGVQKLALRDSVIR